MPGFSLILPCYNENEHIRRSLPAIREFLASFLSAGTYEIILVDDGSTDGTRDYLRSLPQDAEIRVEFNARNLGRGGAVKRGLELARGTITGFMDIDREVSEVFIPKFLHAIRSGADLVVGNRVYTLHWSPQFLLRHLLSVGYKELIRLFMRVPVKDSEAGYKFFSESAKQAILRDSQFDNWFWDTEVALIADMNGLRTEDVPVLFIRDADKTSTVRIFRDTALYLAAIRRFRRLKSAGAYGNAHLSLQAT